MEEELMRKMREILLDRFGVDVAQAVFRFSTQNYAFIFPDRPYMIRVSMTPKRSREEILSELMWVDDVKSFKQTICEPEPSQNDKLLEEFEINGTTYRASMFRKARGNVSATSDITPMYLICVGDLLGTIHHVSTDERRIGMRYKRRTLAENFADLKARAQDQIPPDVLKRIERLEAQVNALPQDEGRYGIIHGDFHSNNFFQDGNNIWIFDFDSCCYGNYLFDVAAFVQSCFLGGYQAGRDAREVLYEQLLPYFSIGYGLVHEAPDGYWDSLELFLSYRTAYAYMALFDVDECGVVSSLDEIKAYLAALVKEDDILAAVTRAGQQRAAAASAK